MSLCFSMIFRSVASTHHEFGSLSKYLGHISGHSKRKWFIFNCCPTWIRTMNKGSKGLRPLQEDLRAITQKLAR